MPTEPTPRRSEDELIALVRQKAAGMRQRRRMAALGACTLALLLVASGIAIAGSDTGSKRTLRTAGVPTSIGSEEATSTSEAPTSTTTTVPVVVPTSSTTTTTVPAVTHWRTVDGASTVDVTVTPGRPATAQTATFSVRTHNDHGQLFFSGADWGDGSTTDAELLLCDVIAIGPDGQSHREGGFPPDAPPADTTESYQHAYRQAGTYHVTLNFVTPQCDGQRAVKSVGDLAVAAGPRRSNGPEQPTLSLNQAQNIDATGTDEDGYVRRIVVDWGDGSPKATQDFSLSDCVDDGRSWPSVRQPPDMNGRKQFQEATFSHTYAHPGHYTITGTVTSTGCTGADAQQGTGTLGFDAQ